jgi:AraC-like DNA-binding protein
MLDHKKGSYRHRAVRVLLVKKLLDEKVLVHGNIAEEVGVSMQTLKKIIVDLKDPNYLKNLHQEVMLKIRVETQRNNAIKSQLDWRDKLISIKDVQYSLRTTDSIQLSVDRIQKIAHQLGYTFSKMRPLQQYVNKEINIQKRALYASRLIRVLERGLDLCSIDESSFNQLSYG